ncbi:MAG: hypothetical protein IIZ93_09030 [Acidaminococcaceae bacterium]|nr:hypothetical protein [Acidaminococcaceae bacterium]
MTLQEKYVKQKEINKELVDENEALKFAARMSEKTEKQLRAEIEEFKETNHELAELAIKRQKEIDELEKCRQILSDCTDRKRKENAELIEKINILENCYRLGDTITEAYKGELAKAKEIIKGLLDLPDLIEDRTFEHTELIGRAEQFLEEEE